MTKHPMKLLVGCIICTLLLAACSKTSGPDLSGTVTETQNALVSGHLFLANGAPAKNIKVAMVPATYDPHGDLVQTTAINVTTDSTGWFGTNSLEPGLYNIFGSDSTESKKSYKSQVAFTGDTLHVGNDTLLPPGTLKGSLTMHPGDDPKTVTVDIIGSFASAYPKASGEFALTNMARGSYFVRFRSSDPKYAVLDTMLPIASGTTQSLANSVVLPLKIPIPTNFGYSYDSLAQIVTLTWNRMNPLKISGFNIYRGKAGSSEIKLNTVPFQDTLFKDSSVMQDSTYTYRIAGVDSLGKDGEKTENLSITINSVFHKVLSFGGKGTDNGLFGEIKDIKCLKDGNIVVLDFENSNVQIFDSLGNFVAKWGSYGTSDGQFCNPISMTLDDSGNIYILEFGGSGRLQKFTQNGSFIASWNTNNNCQSIALSGNTAFIIKYPSQLIKLDLLSSSLETLTISGNPGLTSVAISNSKELLYLGSNSAPHIIITDTDGKIIDAFGKHGTYNGSFLSISSIQLDRSGNYFVSDLNNCQIQIFSPNNTFVTKNVICQKPDGEDSVTPDDLLREIALLPETKTLFATTAHKVYKLTYQLPE